jgi:Glycosyltransferase WbsX
VFIKRAWLVLLAVVVSSGFAGELPAGLSRARSEDVPQYMVGAFYFGSFDATAAGIIDGTREVYNRRGDWWGGVVDFYGREPGIPKDDRGWTGDWSGLKPAIGYYDDSSTEVLEKQIRQASDAGLGFFSFYWYPSLETPGGEALAGALHTFLKARNRELLKFNITIYSHPWNDDFAIGPANAEMAADRIVSYFAEPNYLRLPDGRPVLALGDYRNVRSASGEKCVDKACLLSAAEHFIALIKRRAVAKIGIAPFIEIQAGATGWDEVAGVDATTCLTPPVTIEGGTRYPDLDASVFRPLVSKSRVVSPCMLVNFDERPRQDILIKDRSKIRYLIGKTRHKFRNNLLAAKQFSELQFSRAANPAARIIYLYAWNEWHEGGVIEPNIATGSEDLETVSEVFHLPQKKS